MLRYVGRQSRHQNFQSDNLALYSASGLPSQSSCSYVWTAKLNQFSWWFVQVVLINYPYVYINLLKLLSLITVVYSGALRTGLIDLRYTGNTRT